MGKTSLMARFFRHCDSHSIPAIFIDMTVATATNMRDVLMQIQTHNTPEFDKAKNKLRTSYETLAAALQPYGAHANAAADLLQKTAGKDESLGLIGDAVKGAAKVVFDFAQRAENKSLQALLQKPEESMLRALLEDFQSKQGVILIDTLERTAELNITTQLEFLGDGEITTLLPDVTDTTPFITYCAGLAHFFLDDPVLMVMAGRPPGQNRTRRPALGLF